MKNTGANEKYQSTWHFINSCMYVFNGTSFIYCLMYLFIHTFWILAVSGPITFHITTHMPMRKNIEIIFFFFFKKLGKPLCLCMIMYCWTADILILLGVELLQRKPKLKQSRYLKR